LARGGMSIARVNCSHGGAEGNKQKFADLIAVRKKHGFNYQIMLDTKGPEIRLGFFENDSVTLKDGDEFTLTTTECLGDKRRVFVNCPTLPTHVKHGQIILLSDGMIKLIVKSINGTDVLCTIKNGGVLSNRKTLFAPNCHLGFSFLSEYDKADLKLGKQLGAEIIAASFVSSKQDILEINEFMEHECGGTLPIIAKIESSDGIKNLDGILSVVYGVMVARGDLGVEYLIEEIPGLQKHIIRKANKAGKFVVVATEMMESLVEKPRPTRAETTDVYNAVHDGADATMLSAETAIAINPERSIAYMRRIIVQAEKELDQHF